MSSYTGLYVQRLESGEIHGVQVVDHFGNSLSLEPEIYIQRQINPPINTLPNIDEYKAEISKPKISPIIIALVDWVNGKSVSEEALYRMQQFGFIFPDFKGVIKLTPYGEQTLRDNGLL